VRRLAILVAMLSVGCVTGGATDDPPSKKDAIGLPDDFIEDEDTGAPPEEDTGSTAEDTATPDPDAPPPEDTTPPPMDTACTPTCVACGADDGCGNPCMTGSCATGTCVAGKCETPVTPTKSYIAPGDYAFGTAWARGITWTIGSEGPSTIRYTTDGSTPTAASAGKTAPAELFVSSSGTVIKWYADNGAKEATIHSITASILTSGQTAYGYIVEKTNLGGKGPVIVASPGATISGTAAYQAWNNSGCPMCRYQLIYGVGTAAAGCMYDWSPGVWPGASGSGTISVKAPSTPGVYDLNVSYTLQVSCADGIATAPIGVRPTASIGKIVVR
jgi:hypothetical protein